jgi:hypothetical protein
MGYEITPVVTTTDDGREVVTDFNVNGGNVTGRDGSYVGHQEDFIEDSEGRIQYKYENWVEETNAEEQSQYSEDEYWEGVLEADPVYRQAIDWASDGFFTEEQSKDWDRLMETGTDDQIHNALENLKNQFIENGGLPQEVEETESDLDEVSEEDMAEIQSVAQDLMSQDADPEIADGYDEVGLQALESGNECYSAICSATALFHRGEVSAGDAIDSILNNYPLAEVKRCWAHLNNQ